MSLRWRLLLSLGMSFLLLWLSVGAMMFLHLNQQVAETLDQRLAASANMVAGLIARQPDMLTPASASPLELEPEGEGVACQIRAASGEVLLQTSGARGSSLRDSRPGFSSRRIGGDEWRLYTLKQDGVFITTADRMSERATLENSIILVMVVPFLLALLGGLAVLWLGVRRGLQPLQRLHDALSKREPRNLNPLHIGAAPLELTPVVDTLNTLFARVERMVAREQRFASDAAHEFRTPLTGIKTHLQVARKVTGVKQEVALNNAEEGVVRLQRVTEQLLMLARLEQGEAWQGEASCKVSDILDSVMADVPAGDRVRIDNQVANAQVGVPVTLAAVALRNLIDNALKYSAHECVVLIRKEQPSEPGLEGMVSFLVSDSGGGRRSQARNSGLKESPGRPDGHGLGLAIVEAITSQCGGSLVSDFNAASGMDWWLRFPATST